MRKKLANIISQCLTLTETYVGSLARPLQQFSHRYLLAFNRWLLSKFDPLSYAIEGTLFKKILQVTIFPVFMVLTIIIGFELVENEYSRVTFTLTVLSLMMLGIVFAPLERLIPFSRRWLDDKDEPTDVMVFFGNHAFERYFDGPLYLATVALVYRAGYLARALASRCSGIPVIGC
jgi:hypothetical protein